MKDGKKGSLVFLLVRHPLANDELLKTTQTQIADLQCFFESPTVTCSDEKIRSSRCNGCSWRTFKIGVCLKIFTLLLDDCWPGRCMINCKKIRLHCTPLHRLFKSLTFIRSIMLLVLTLPTSGRITMRPATSWTTSASGRVSLV